MNQKPKIKHPKLYALNVHLFAFHLAISVGRFEATKSNIHNTSVGFHYRSTQPTFLLLDYAK